MTNEELAEELEQLLAIRTEYFSDGEPDESSFIANCADFIIRNTDALRAALRAAPAEPVADKPIGHLRRNATGNWWFDAPHLMNPALFNPKIAGDIALFTRPQAAPSGWVSCEERMPREGTYVLVPAAGQVIGVLYAGGEWRQGYRVYSGINHWMPLPSPPRADREST